MLSLIGWLLWGGTHQHPDIVRVSFATDEFLCLWREGFRAYLDGNWTKAREIFSRTEKYRRAERKPSMFHASVKIDGPSHTLLQVMAEHNYVAPADWRWAPRAPDARRTHCCCSSLLLRTVCRVLLELLHVQHDSVGHMLV